MKDNKPSLILSGINPGDNTGDAVNLSGTLGAAFMGLMMGTPSIGISQAHKHGEETRWDTARAIAPIMLRHFLTYGWKKDTCLSINIPNLPAEEIPGFTWAKQSLKNAVELRVDVLKDTSDELYYWERHFHQTPSQDHSDWTVLQRGHVAVTALGLDRSIDVREPPVLFDEAVTDEPADE
jgi:5'-nucleotidase